VPAAQRNASAPPYGLYDPPPAGSAQTVGADRDGGFVEQGVGDGTAQS
jgi:hypothetical protein